MANLSNINNKFLVTTGGNVGIGTTSPSSKLSNSAILNAAASGLGTSVLGLNWEIPAGGSSQGYVASFANTQTASSNYNAGVLIEVGSTDTTTRLLSVESGGTNRFEVRGDGNVGIGTTSPAVKLHVQSTGVPTIAQSSSSSITSGSRGDLAWYNSSVSTVANIRAGAVTDNVGTNLQFYTRPAGGSLTETMRISSTGTVTLTGDKTIDTTNTLRINAGGATLYLDSATDVLIRTNGTSQAFVAKADGRVYNYQSGNKANTYYGYQAGNYAGTGQSNTAIGYDASPALTTGNTNISIGRDAGKSLTTGTINISIGNSAGYSNVDGTQNTYIGHSAGYTSPGQNYNTFVGRECGYHNTANSSTAVGRNAMHANSTGFGNTAMGTQALTANQTGSWNTAIGYQAQANSTSSNNTAVGYRAGYYYTTGIENTSMGYQAGYSSSAASTGSYNTIIGSNSATDSAGITGSGNTFLGRAVGYFIASGGENVMIGQNSGYSAGESLTGAVLVGYLAGYHCTWNHTVAIGHYACYTQTAGEYNVGIGKDALYTNSTGDRNTAVGYQTLRSATGNYNTAVGMQALYTQGSAEYNTAVGVHAGYSSTTGAQNTLVGYEAGYNIVDTEGNTCVGMRAGKGITGDFNTAIGIQAMNSSGANSYCVCIGYNAGINSTGDENIYIGAYAGDAASQSGGYNTGVGRAGLSAVSSGTYHTSLGYNAGDEITTGTNCTAIGHAAGSGSSPRHMTTNSNEIVIGNNSIVGAYIRVAWTATSDARDKTEFKEISKGLDFVNKLKPTSYKFRKDRDTEETQGRERYGFLAQEVLELEGDNPVIIDNTDEDKLGYTESNLIPVLVKAIQELKAEIEILKSK